VAHEVNHVISMRVSRLSRQRSVLVVLCIATVVAIFVLSRTMTSFIIYDFALLSFGVAILGFSILVLQNRIRSIRATVDFLKEAFSNVDDCAEFLEELLKEFRWMVIHVNDGFALKEIEFAIKRVVYASRKGVRATSKRWIREFLGMSSTSFKFVAQTLGFHELTKTFLIRAEEYGLLTKKVRGAQVSYHLPHNSK